MRKIILASQSKARQKLLKETGLKFQVVKTNVLERNCFAKNARNDTKITISCNDKEAVGLVMENARVKAEDAAKDLRSGVVIGADTVVLVGSRIIGKPKNIKDAFRILKLISRRPQLVYTGLAVIDIDAGKVWTDYEKTKIYMAKLSDAQIENYFRKVNPLDKSGAFDIQGIGSVFIERIEGCFYNVVGLPLSKLAKMLSKAGINVL